MKTHGPLAFFKECSLLQENSEAVGGDERPCCQIQHGKLQNIFRVVYPFLFISFNIGYWAYFINID